MRKIKRVHMVGIGGSGMGGIAEVLNNLGYAVSGSDISNTPMMQRLKKIGIQLYFNHHPRHVYNADVVVSSTAIAKDNVELQMAREMRIPIVQRAMMLAELMRFKHGIAVAGAHGKTTTTSVIASIFAQAGLDPTFVVGGLVNQLGSNAKLGTSRYFIAEACESDASFLHLSPLISVITNIDQDHLENYQFDFNQLKKTYVSFIHRLPFYGLAILCWDDAEIRKLSQDIARPFISYGFHEDADIRACNLKQQQYRSFFDVIRKGKPPLHVELNLPGKFNVLNALAAMTVATEENIPDEKILHALKHFAGVGRRFQMLDPLITNDGQATLIDDYGHHPNEIDSIIETVRNGWPNKRLIMVFQPHRYSRTKNLFEDFVQVLSKVDVLILLDVYAASETPIHGADSKSLCGSIRARGLIEPIYVKDHKEVYAILSHVLLSEDVVIMQGAGDIGQMASQFSSEFNSMRELC